MIHLRKNNDVTIQLSVSTDSFSLDQLHDTSEDNIAVTFEAAQQELITDESKK